MRQSLGCDFLIVLAAVVVVEVVRRLLVINHECPASWTTALCAGMSLTVPAMKFAHLSVETKQRGCHRPVKEGLFNMRLPDFVST